MKSTWSIVVAASVAIPGLCGCGSSDPKHPPIAADSASPDVAVRTFLEAVRKGDDKKAAAMLTPTARVKTAERDLTVSPPGSPTATFEVGDVEYVTPDKDGAHVASSWTDTGLDNKRNTDQIVWVLRKEIEGWRIAGMAIKIFEGELPLILNFEDPDDMIRKQELAAKAIAERKAQEAALQADHRSSALDDPLK